LQKLVNALNQDNVLFYIHIDKKSSLPQIQGKNIHILKNRVDVHWGGFSQVEATLLLLEEALKNGFDYAAFISGKDYPVKPNEWLNQTLSKGGEFIQMNKMGTDPFAPLSRYKYYYFTDHYQRRNKKSIKTKIFLQLQKKLRQLKIAKRIPFQLYTGACWFVLSHDCINYILQQVYTNSKLMKFFRSGFCPDEGFFQTIIGNSPFAGKVKPCMTYADWSVDPGPAMFTELHFPVIASMDAIFFARKFDDNSGKLLSQIDEKLRTL